MKTFSIGSKAPRQRQATHVVRIGHPQEQAIVALLERLSAGEVENVADLAEEAKNLLLDDGIYASFSTRQFRNGQISDEPFRDYNDGQPSLPRNQFLLYGRKPGTADEGEAEVLYRSWDSGRSKAGFTKPFMDWAVADYRETLGQAAPVGSQQLGSAQAPAGTPGQQAVRLS